MAAPLRGGRAGRSDTARGRTECRHLGEIPYGAPAVQRFFTLVFDVGLDRVIAFAVTQLPARLEPQNLPPRAQRMRGETPGPIGRQNPELLAVRKIRPAAAVNP